jgi:hypothetical protein
MFNKKTLCIAGMSLALSGLASAIEFRTSGFMNISATLADTGKVDKQEFIPGNVGTGAGAIPDAADALNQFYPRTVRPKWQGHNMYPEFGQDAVLGLQFDGDVSDNFTVTSQLTSAGEDDYTVRMQWLLGRWTYSENLTLRFGRFRNPFFMIAEYQQVGYAQPWARPPAHLYSMMPDAFSNTTGVNVMYTHFFGDIQFLISLLYGGGKINYSLDDRDDTLFIVEAQKSVDIIVSNDEFKFKASFSHAKLTLENLPATIAGYGGISRYTPSAVFNGLNTDWDVLITDRDQTIFGNVSFMYDANNILFMAEYARRINPGFISSQYAMYATLGYQFGNVLPSVTYSRLRTTDKHIIKNLSANNNNGLVLAIPEIKETLDTNLNRDEDGVAFDLKWNPWTFVAIKGGIAFTEPRNGSAGLHSDKLTKKRSMIYTFGVNLVF